LDTNGIIVRVHCFRQSFGKNSSAVFSIRKARRQDSQEAYSAGGSWRDCQLSWGKSQIGTEILLTFLKGHKTVITVIGEGLGVNPDPIWLISGISHRNGASGYSPLRIGLNAKGGNPHLRSSWTGCQG